MINMHANNGRARKKWKAVAPLVESRILSNGGGAPELIPTPVTGLREQIARCAGDGPCTIIAAGGDGTVNRCANAIMAMPDVERSRFVLGAIGLGSSNDFHKPVSNENRVGNVPVRIDDARPVMHNAGLVTYHTGTQERRRFFVVNAGMGAVAEGNRLFNEGDAVIRRLKPVWVAAAINYTAIKAVLSYKNISAAINVEDAQHNVKVSNLGIVINPFFTGSCRYDTPVTSQSTYMCANLLENLNRRQLLAAFYHFGKGRFLGRPGARSWNVQDVSVVPVAPAALEIDGEVETVTAARFSLVKEAIAVCQ